MEIDLSKLTPAPWEVHDGRRPDYTICEMHADETCQPLFERIGPPNTEDGNFIVLARNAFDVMMRRGWGITRFDDGWMAVDDDDLIVEPSSTASYPDPFTALVEADRRHKKNGENCQ